ncbi:MAG: glycoside hydrolase family 88 protein [Chitinophagaceae bacterium]
MKWLKLIYFHLSADISTGQQLFRSVEIPVSRFNICFSVLHRSIVCLLILPLSVFSQKITRSSVLQSMELANSYFMQKWPDPFKAIVTNKARPSNIWTRAVYYEGLMELYRLNNNKQLLDYALLWGARHDWNLRGGYTTVNADDQACGQTYIDLFFLQKDSAKITNIKQSIDHTIQSNRIDYWTWIDAIQMAMPVFAKLGKLYNDDTLYYNYMYRMYRHTRDVEAGGLFNAKDGIWWRDKDFVPPYKEPNGQYCYWSRGNGWVVAALVRVLETIPKNEMHRKEYERDLIQMLKALKPLQRSDGFWNVSLLDSTHFGGKETSGTALFVYGYASAVNNGLLNAKEYLPVIRKAWNGMVNAALHSDGFLGYVQGTGKEPKDGQPVNYNNVPDFEDYGLGCFLLAGSEVYQLKKL